MFDGEETVQTFIINKKLLKHGFLKVPLPMEPRHNIWWSAAIFCSVDALKTSSLRLRSSDCIPEYE